MGKADPWYTCIKPYAFESQAEVAKLASFAILLLKIIVNQAGCEQTFSNLEIKQAQCRNCLVLTKLAKLTKVY